MPRKIEESKRFSSKIIALLKKGDIGVIPTDTIYGLVGSALKPKVVEKIYKLRRRNPKKPIIVLISNISDLKKFFSISLNSQFYILTSRFWPGPTSIILPCPSKKFTYLHRGTKTIAFRIPKPASIRAFLKKTGPLVAPSANIEGEPPAKTIREAKKYFGAKIDFYVDSGRKQNKPSKVVKIINSKIKFIR